MGWQSSLQSNRRYYCAQAAQWLVDNRGYVFRDAIKFVYEHYKQMADWLGDGKSAEWAAQELLAQQVTESDDETEDGR